MLDNHMDVEGSIGGHTCLAGLCGFGVQKHTTATVSTHTIWRAAEELSCERLARLHSLVGEIRAH